MATPTLLFNSSTGSDTAASGAGPSTSLTGTAASYATTVVTLDGSPDLSGVATDSSHVLYLVTSTGRKFFAITAVDNTLKTVTVADAPAGTTTGLTWAIGGKRSTFNSTNSRLLFSADIKGGWQVHAEDDGAVAITGSAMTLGGTGTAQSQVLVKGTSTSSRRACTQSANAAHFSQTVTGWCFENLTFTNTNGTKTSANAFSIGANSMRLTVKNCRFGDGTNHLNSAILSASQTLIVRLFDCGFTGQRSGATAGQVIDFGGNGIHQVRLRGCYSTSAVGPCIRMTGTGSSVIDLWRTVIHAPAGDVITVAATAGCELELLDSTLNGGSADGIDISAGIQLSVTILGTQITNFAGGSMYGIRGATGQDGQFGIIVDCNNYFNNTSSRLNFPTGTNDISVDPEYISSGTGNFGVGSSVQAKGWPGGASVFVGAGLSITSSYNDIGAAQHQEPTGVGMVFFPGGPRTIGNERVSY